MIQPNPVTIQLRYLQALQDISVNQASTIVFPLPIDVVKPLLDRGGDAASALPACPQGQLELGAADTNGDTLPAARPG